MRIEINSNMGVVSPENAKKRAMRRMLHQLNQHSQHDMSPTIKKQNSLLQIEQMIYNKQPVGHEKSLKIVKEERSQIVTPSKEFGLKL